MLRGAQAGGVLESAKRRDLPLMRAVAMAPMGSVLIDATSRLNHAPALPDVRRRPHQGSSCRHD
jgi:hypothetical protein